MFSSVSLYGDKDMEKLITRNNFKKWEAKTGKKGIKYGEPHEQPRVVIQRMRSVVGAYLYMTDKRVNTIFVNQVNRIGEQLERLEQALPKHPRVVKKGGRGQPERIVTYSPWKYLNLQKKWYVHMDEVYNRADKKAQTFMETNLKRLKDEYSDGKMLKQSDVDKEKDKDKQKTLRLEKELREAMKPYIEKLEKEWTKTKNWPKPQWNT